MTKVVFIQSIVGCLLAGIGMTLAIGLVRVAANLVVIIIGLGTCLLVVSQIANQTWLSWPDVCIYALLSGAGAALLTLPVLPFSSFWRGKK
jgi:hypothetical protein